MPARTGACRPNIRGHQYALAERAFVVNSIHRGDERRSWSGIFRNSLASPRHIVLARHKNSVWRGKGESQAQWELVRAGLSLVEACEDYERQLPEHARSQADLLDFYLSSLREADRLQREFEQAVGDFLDPHGLMQEVIDQARVRYRRLAEKVQTVFIKYIETTGWPPQGRLSNADVFDRLLADRLRESGRRVAYLMVDALSALRHHWRACRRDFEGQTSCLTPFHTRGSGLRLSLAAPWPGGESFNGNNGDCEKPRKTSKCA
jgi:hypothetical protein